jgi:hypothetical protein
MHVELDDPDGVISILQRKTGSKDVQELFSNALTLLRWAVEAREEGHVIGIMNPEQKTYRELQMPALDYAATRR